MSPEPVVVVHTSDDELAAALVDGLGDLGVLRTRGGEELGRLVGRPGTVCLVVDLVDEPDKGWRRVAVIREALPDLRIVARTTCGAGPSAPDGGRSPADLVVDTTAAAVDAVRRLLDDAWSAPEDEPLPPPPVAVPVGTAGTTWGVVGLSGGVGTTTFALLLATRLAGGASATLADLDDRHGALAGTLRLAPRYTTADIIDVAGDPERLREALPSCLTSAGTSLRLLAAPEAPGTDEGLPPKALPWLLEAAAELDPYLVADLGDLPFEQYDAVTGLSDVVLVAAHDIRSARRLPAALDALADRAPGPRVHLVLNGVVEGMTPTPVELEAVTGRRWDAVVPHLDAVRAAHNDTVGDGPRSLATAPPRELAAAVAALLGQTAPTHHRRLRRRRHAPVSLRRSS